jgi:hypothetical protein
MCFIARSCVSGAKRNRTDFVVLGNRQYVNDTIEIAMRMKGGAMLILECGRRRRPGAEVQT